MKRTGIAFAIVALTTSCGSQREVALPQEVTSAFEEAFASKDAAKVAALFTTDAQVFPQDRPAIVGREQIQSYLAEQMDPVLMFDSTTEQSFARDDLGVEVGSYTFRDTRRGSDIESGKYILLWRKENEEWKLYRTMYNTDNPTKGDVAVTHTES